MRLIIVRPHFTVGMIIIYVINYGVGFEKRYASYIVDISKIT